MMVRVGLGVVLATAIALVAHRAGSLSRSGAMAATVIGAAAIAAGWDWGILLIAFFVSSSALSRLGSEVKERRTSSIIAKGGARDAVQVLANGGLFAAAALLALLTRWPGWPAIGAGALAAASADTWGTEIGTLMGRRPRLLTTWRPVDAGVSGGVTAPGLLASVAGALFVAGIAAALGWPATTARAAFVGGVAGALADSLLGALWQSRRQCVQCETATERVVHTCGNATVPAGGLAWLDNDSVNALASLVGAGVALLTLV